MGKKPYAAIGAGVGLIMWILEMAGVSIPLWLLIGLGIIALGMIVFGGIPVAVSAYHGIQRIKLRTPFVIVRPGVTKASQEQLTQEMIVKEYSAQVRETLDALIKRGEELTHQMQRDDFHKGQLGQEVRQWLDSVEHDVWEAIPEHANLLTTNQRSTQETFTDQERLRYGGWNRNAAALRVSVDRQLLHLREIRSRIQATDTPQGRNGNRAIARQPEPTLHIAINGHEFWLRTGTGMIREPKGTDYSMFGPGELFLRVYTTIDVRPRMLVENMECDISKPPIAAERWVSERMEGRYDRDLDFVILKTVTPGEHDIRVIGTADGEKWASSQHSVHVPIRLFPDT